MTLLSIDEVKARIGTYVDPDLVLPYLNARPLFSLALRTCLAIDTHLTWRLDSHRPPHQIATIYYSPTNKEGTLSAFVYVGETENIYYPHGLLVSMSNPQMLDWLNARFAQIKSFYPIYAGLDAKAFASAFISQSTATSLRHLEKENAGST